MRKGWVRLHRYLGLTAALFLLLAGFTGSIIAYQEEFDAWLNPQLFNSPARGPLLGAAELLVRLEHELPQYRVVSLPLQHQVGQAVRVTVRPAGEGRGEDADELFIDPVDGKLLGGRIWGACCLERQHLIPFIYVLHYSLQLPGEIGLWLMGVVAIVWLFESLLGFYLTLPKLRPQSKALSQEPRLGHKTWWQRWAMAWRIKPGAGGIRFNFDVHRACGLWLSALMLIMSVSAVALNLHDAVFEPVVSLFSEFTPTPFDTREERGEAMEAEVAFIEVVRVAVGEAERRGWQKSQSSIFYNAQFGIFGVGFGGEDGLGPWFLYYDGVTGGYLGDYIPGSGTAADRFDAWQLPLHSGRIIGWPGRVVVSLIGLAVLVLVITGVQVWLSKSKSPRRI